jgi:hypothetical protein
MLPARVVAGKAWMTRGMRDKAVTALLIPVLVLPLVVIAAGGDLELIWQEFKSFSRAPLMMTVYAGQASPPVNGSPTVTPSGPVTPGPGGAAAAPLLSRWAMISASIVLALVALWAINRRNFRDGPQR